MRNWYVCQTKPRCEQSAEINLLQQGYETYLPQTLIDKRLKKNHYRSTEPLFPGYLFVKLSTKSDDWRPIQSTKGITTIVKFGNIPAIVPNELIIALKENEDSQGISQVFKTDYVKGEQVRLLNKPFELVRAIIHTVAKDRIFLVLDILGQKTRLEVGYRDIEPVCQP